MAACFDFSVAFTFPFFTCLIELDANKNLAQCFYRKALETAPFSTRSHLFYTWKWARIFGGSSHMENAKGAGFGYMP
jgi:hypothetical protein